MKSLLFAIRRDDIAVDVTMLVTTMMETENEHEMRAMRT